MLILRDNRMKYKFDKVDEKFIDYIFDQVINEGWSIAYACRDLKGGILALRRNLIHHPKLQNIYDWYMMSKNKKAKFGYRNIHNS